MHLLFHAHGWSWNGNEYSKLDMNAKFSQKKHFNDQGLAKVQGGTFDVLDKSEGSTCQMQMRM